LSGGEGAGRGVGIGSGGASGQPEGTGRGGPGGDGPLSRRQRFVVFGVTLALVAAAVAMIVFSLQRPEVQEYLPTSANPSPVGDSLVGPVTYTVDASASSEWVFFDFSRGSVIPDPGPLEWDLAFQRFYIVSNGGEAFDGRGGLLDLGAVPFDSVEAVPTGGYVFSEADRDTTNAATAEWYDYSFTSHLLTPSGHTYAVRTADGRYAKLEVVGYYCPGARPGCLTFRYAYQGDGSARVVGDSSASAEAERDEAWTRGALESRRADGG